MTTTSDAKTKKPTWFCQNCGGHDVRHDATVQWNPETEDWDVLAVHDNAWCEPCSQTEESDITFAVPSEPDAEQEA